MLIAINNASGDRMKNYTIIFFLFLVATSSSLYSASSSSSLSVTSSWFGWGSSATSESFDKAFAGQLLRKQDYAEFTKYMYKMLDSKLPDLLGPAKSWLNEIFFYDSVCAYLYVRNAMKYDHEVIFSSDTESHNFFVLLLLSLMRVAVDMRVYENIMNDYKTDAEKISLQTLTTFIRKIHHLKGTLDSASNNKKWPSFQSVCAVAAKKLTDYFASERASYSSCVWVNHCSFWGPGWGFWFTPIKSEDRSIEARVAIFSYQSAASSVVKTFKIFDSWESFFACKEWRTLFEVGEKQSDHNYF